MHWNNLKCGMVEQRKSAKVRQNYGREAHRDAMLLPWRQDGATSQMTQAVYRCLRRQENRFSSRASSSHIALLTPSF